MPYPGFRTNHFDLVPMDWMGDEELAALGPELHEMAAQPETQQMLAERHLDGVALRHGDADDSNEAVRRALEQHTTTNHEFFGVLVDGERWIGMASIMPSLPLYVPRLGALGLLPAGITRRNRALAARMPTDGPNLTAWVGAEHEHRLADTYGKLGEIAGRGWTIEPVNSRGSSRALRAAGFRPVGPRQRYDDMETGNTPPLSQYFVRGEY